MVLVSPSCRTMILIALVFFLCCRCSGKNSKTTFPPTVMMSKGSEDQLVGTCDKSGTSLTAKPTFTYKKIQSKVLAAA